MEKVRKKLDVFSKKITTIPILMAIRDGLGSSWHVLGIISFMTLLTVIPNKRYQNFVMSTSFFYIIQNLSLVMMKVYLVFILISTSYHYAIFQKENGLKHGILGLLFYLSLYPSSVLKNHTFLEIFTYDRIIPSLVFSILFLKIYIFLSQRLKYSDGKGIIPPMVVQSLNVYMPTVFIISLNTLVVTILYQWKQIIIVDIFTKFLVNPFLSLGRSILFPVIYQFFSTLLWFFGLNGPSVTNVLYSPITTSLSIQNLESMLNNQTVINIQSWAFSDFLSNYGGGGSTLSLVILMLFFSQSNKFKNMAKTAIIPSIFGINEMIIFGFPVIMNIDMLVPFVLVPTLNMTLAYWATQIELIPKMTALFIPWTTPIFVSGWLLTGSYRTVLFQGFQLLLGCLIYYPFFKKEDLKQRKIEKQQEQTL